jgi:hypothetical protein
MSSGPGRPSPAAAPPSQPRTAEQPSVWVARGGKKAGPITPVSLQRRILRRELNGRDHVWWEGAQGWTPIADVPALARLLPLSEPTPDPADPFAAARLAPVVDRAPAAARESTRVFLMKAGLSQGQRWRRHLALGLALVGGLAGVAALALVLLEQPTRMELPEMVIADAPRDADDLNDWDDVAVEPDGTVVTSTWRCLQGGDCTADDEPPVLVRKQAKRPRVRRQPQQPQSATKPAIARSTTTIDDDGLADITHFGGFGSRELDVGEKAHVRLKLSIEAPAVDGGERDAEAVFAVVKTRMGGLSDCASGAYAATLPAGRHEIVFTVDEAGTISRIRLGGALRASAAGSCVRKQVRKWRLPAASGEATVSFPLILTR